MSTTQIPITGVFDRAAGQFLGVAATGRNFHRIGVPNIPQMLTVACGNSINDLNRYGQISGTYWNINSELHIANSLAGAPMRFGRLATSGGTASNWNNSGTGKTDIYGTYGYSGQTLATINSDIETNWFAPILTAGKVPDLVLGMALLENDIVAGATVAQMTARLTTWIAMVRRWAGVKILLCTPRPSFTYNTPALVAAYQSMRDYMLSLDDGASIFVARLDDYENPASPGTPLGTTAAPLYTDNTVHPNTAGAFVNARVIVMHLNRIARSFAFPYRILSNNYALTGSTAVTGTNVTGTGPTGSGASGAGTANAQTVVLAAEDPCWTATVTQNAGVAADWGTVNTGAISYAGGASTQVSTFAEIEIVSGAENIRWIGLEPRINDGGGNNFQQFQQAQTSDADGLYMNGDVLTLLVPPQIAASGNISAIQPFIRVIAKTGGSGTAALAAGTYKIRYRRTGVGIVVA